MSVLYNFLVEENERLKKQVDELKDFLYVADVVCSHLVQDSDLTIEGEQAIKSFHSYVKELQDKHDKKNKLGGSHT